ncbi:phage terminase large subunit family protein [Bradyrhizobium sp. SSUT18]|uniref:phage terminase large subunit family protein n=1 Tax=Bradyrhizobium sp. SSUT18 TaxID=3040602 RepID=UPI002447ED4E|nr:phage terminase large subunit family protein [Bradyrhizobium sp. SSUT18]MDH2407010.1 phage terminase large subunit family protein [Bradyrhizobium sp. SSUT18]
MIDEQLARGWLRAPAPPPIVAPTNFAETQIILPSSANAIPGPLRLTAYQREPIDAIADNDVEIIVLMLASQTGKSTVIRTTGARACRTCPPLSTRAWASWSW